MKLPLLTVELVLQTVVGIGVVAALRALASGRRDRQIWTAMTETPTSQISEVRANGYYEVKGTAWTADPLPAPRTREPMVFFRYRCIERWEVRHKTSWYPRERVLEDTLRVVPFRVRDKSGEILVTPEGAELEGHRLTSEVQGNRGESGGLFAPSNTRNYHRVHELYGARNGSPIYVLGPTRRGEKGPLFGRRFLPSGPFVISSYSEEELTCRLHDDSWARVLLATLIGLVVVVCLVALVLLPPEALAQVIRLDRLR